MDLVPKKNGKGRVCGDFKVRIILQLNVDNIHYQKSKKNLLSLSEGQHFSKIDESRLLLNINGWIFFKVFNIVNSKLTKEGI